MIELSRLTKRYEGKKAPPVTALDHVDLCIQQGELAAVMGPSGAGKSTLLNILGLLDRPTSGSYRLNGTAVEALGARQRAALRNAAFGFVVQDFAVLERETVYQNVAIPLAYSKVPKADRKKKVRDILAQLQVEEKLHVPAGHLSGGQRQRVAIARALVNEPDIILADEPTGALDQKTGQEVLRILQEINKAGKTVIIVTHDRNVAIRCHKVIHLLDGRIARIEDS